MIPIRDTVESRNYPVITHLIIAANVVVYLIQLISASLSPVQERGIAWWAHIGGFLFGMIFLKLFARVPENGITRAVKSKTARKKTPHLQAIHATATPEDPHLYGDMVISPEEALTGARKLVNIP